MSCSQPFSFVQTVISRHSSLELLKVIGTALKRVQFPPAFVVFRRENPIAVEEDWSLGSRHSKCENPMFSSLVTGVCIQYEQKSSWQLVWQLISGYYFRLKSSSFFICIETFLQLKGVVHRAFIPLEFAVFSFSKFVCSSRQSASRT